jgi:hypothetical protein
MLTQRSINLDPGYAHIMITLVQEHQTFVTRRHPFSARLCVTVAAMVGLAPRTSRVVRWRDRSTFHARLVIELDFLPRQPDRRTSRARITLTKRLYPFERPRRP